MNALESSASDSDVVEADNTNRCANKLKECTSEQCKMGAGCLLSMCWVHLAFEISVKIGLPFCCSQEGGGLARGSRAWRKQRRFHMHCSGDACIS